MTDSKVLDELKELRDYCNILNDRLKILEKQNKKLIVSELNKFNHDAILGTNKNGE